MKQSPLYRLEVAPLLILPLSRSPFFSYAASTPVAHGSLVSISFGRQTVEGIVFDCQPLPGPKPSWMKPLNRVVTEHFLTEEQCALAEQVSSEYFTPLGKTLKHFLPKQVGSKKEPAAKTVRLKTLRPTAAERDILETLNRSKQQKPWYLDTASLPDPKRLLVQIAKERAKDKGQTLIIVPELNLAVSLAAFFETFFASHHIAVLHSKLSHGAFFEAWERVRSGEATVVIATRPGLFAPFAHLQTIIVTEEQDESYKQWDMSPRYHGKRVASFLAKLHQADLILVSGTPSVESVHDIAEHRITPLVPLAGEPPLAPKLTIVNLKLERYRRNFSPLSEALTLAIRETLGRGEQVLLYINRQGMNAFSVCEQCKAVFRCPQCERPLGGSKEGSFRCAACGFATALFPSCPGCGHLSFRSVGFGTEKIEKEARKLFPQARSVRVDSSTLRTGKTLQTTYENGLAGKIDILVGTQMILKDPPLPKLSLIAMIDADSLLLFPDFQADERLFRDLSRAVRQVRQYSGRVFVQTFRPESAFFQKITDKGRKEMWQHILAERKELLYPPFSRFLTLTCQGKTAAATGKQAATAIAILTEHLPKSYRLYPARETNFLKKKNLYTSVILIRFPREAALPATFRAILIGLGKDGIIDVDPATLS